jgi:serine/threonine protein kinase
VNPIDNQDRPVTATDPLDDPRLTQALEEYQAALDAGARPDRRAFLARYADIAGALANCLDGLEMLHNTGSQLQPEAKRPRPAAADPGPAAAALPLGDFRIIREIGRGGMGVVYEAMQLSLGRRVALKVLPFAVALDQRQLQRFKNEAQAAALLHHTNIVPVFAVGCERGVYYYAMQYIESRTVAALVQELRQAQGLELLQPPASSNLATRAAPRDRGDQPTTISPVAEKKGSGVFSAEMTAPLNEPEGSPKRLPTPFSPETLRPQPAALTERSTLDGSFCRFVARLGIQAAEALEHAHQQGIVHRDIKPANLLLDGRDHLWVTDFGLARCKNDVGLTTTGDLVGTVRYMSPEQALARPGQIDHRTDIYSLGATLYELLTLEPVFAGCDRQDLLRQIAHDEPRPPRSIRKSVPRELETIILKALGKTPDERYATAQELADDLRRFLEDRPILARRPTLVERTGRWLRRHRVVAVATFVVLLLAVLGLTLSTVLIAREQARTRKAYESEAAQLARAEENFRQAREAVDFFTQVSAEEMADRPEMQAIRRKMLERALVYYQKFIDEHGDNPAIRGDLLKCHVRVATILDEMGDTAAALASVDRAVELQEKIGPHPMASELQRDLDRLTVRLTSLPGTSPLHLLSQKSVQEELNLTDEQLKAVADLNEARHDLFRSFRNKSSEEWRQKMDDLAAKEKAVPDLLTPLQARRLQQIALQQRGAFALTEPDVANLLGLTEEQRAQIKGINDQAFVGLPPRHGPRPPDWRKFEEAAKRAKEQMLGLLSADQKAQWDKLMGEPFTGEIVRRGPQFFGPMPGGDPKRRP